MNKAFEMWSWENEPSVETPLSAEFLNKVNTGLNEVDNRVVNQNTTKLDVVVANTMVKDVSFDESTGVFTIIKLNGSTVSIDTKLEKLAVNFSFDYNTQTLNIILEDGTTQTVDLSALITQYEFAESDTIILSVGADGKVVANIKNGSITGDMLEPNYLANVTTQADNARVSAETATSEADRATTEADRAEEAADRAEAVSAVDIATVEKAGIVKPDGTTITVDTDGTIHGSSQGVSQEDFNKVIDGTTTVGNADKLGGHNADYFATTEQVQQKANKSNVTDATLLANNWVETEVPYTNTITVSGVTASNNVEIVTPSNITAEQVEAFQSALILNGTQTVDSITLNAWGEVPTIDLPITIIVRGD